MAVSRRDLLKAGTGIVAATGVTGILASSNNSITKGENMADTHTPKSKTGIRKLEIQKLTMESFKKYGSFADLYEPNTPKILADVGGEKPVEFYRDILPLDMGSKSMVSVSTARVYKRPPIIDAVECHSHSSEGMLPLDSDMVIHVGVATPNNDVPFDSFEVFHIPKGTLVVLDPGTWHHAPFCYGSDVINFMVMLPRRTYVNDNTFVKFPESEYIEIIGLK